jgi:hypothetical protein
MILLFERAARRVDILRDPRPQWGSDAGFRDAQTLSASHPTGPLGSGRLGDWRFLLPIPRFLVADGTTAIPTETRKMRRSIVLAPCRAIFHAGRERESHGAASARRQLG